MSWKQPASPRLTLLLALLALSGVASTGEWHMVNTPLCWCPAAISEEDKIAFTPSSILLWSGASATVEAIRFPSRKPSRWSVEPPHPSEKVVASWWRPPHGVYVGNPSFQLTAIDRIEPEPWDFDVSHSAEIKTHLRVRAVSEDGESCEGVLHIRGLQLKYKSRQSSSSKLILSQRSPDGFARLGVAEWRETDKKWGPSTTIWDVQVELPPQSAPYLVQPIRVSPEQAPWFRIDLSLREGAPPAQRIPVYVRARRGNLVLKWIVLVDVYP